MKLDVVEREILAWHKTSKESQRLATAPGPGDLGEMSVHRGGVGKGHDEARGHSALGTDRAEDVGPLVAGVARRPRPRAALRPDPGERALLADPCLVLEPDLERLVARGFGDRGGYRLAECFLKTSWAPGSVFG